MSRYELILGDCLLVMKGMAENSVDAIVTDPPYGLSSGKTKYLGESTSGSGFMGKLWDHGVPGVEFWEEALRVAKPGAHLLAFGGTRTFHRLAVAIEDAGWEMRDTIGFIHGMGFPKSHDVSKAIYREAGAQREVVGKSPWFGRNPDERKLKGEIGLYGLDTRTDEEAGFITAPATPEAQGWSGWGTGLKPAWEPILVARKPFTGTVAQNVLTYGTGALNVNGCRIATDEETGRNNHVNSYGSERTWSTSVTPAQDGRGRGLGRWPANLIHDGSDEVIELFPKVNDAGSAARFFYCAKANKSDREEGCEHLPLKMAHDIGLFDQEEENLHHD